jgi:Tfp pilus assembly PilM family ATPase
VTTAAIGGRDLDSVIARTLKIDIKKAEELKETKGFMQSEDSHDVFQAIVPVVSSVVSEMGKYISYYETHSGSGNKIVKIILAGGDVNLLGFREHVSRELKLKVEMANPWTNVNFPQYYLPKIVFKDSVRYSTVIGLALGASDSIKYL